MKKTIKNIGAFLKKQWSKSRIAIFLLVLFCVCIILILCLTILSSCGNRNFNKKFWQKYDEALMTVKETDFAYFDLSAITNFEWDSVLFIRGERSIWIRHKEFIEEALNRRVSYLHWEKRRWGGEVDTTFRWHTTDLRPGRDRFFFLTPNKKIIEKEIRHRAGRGFSFSFCDRRDTLSSKYGHWISRQESNFLVTRTGFRGENDTMTNASIRFETNCLNEE